MPAAARPLPRLQTRARHAAGSSGSVPGRAVPDHVGFFPRPASQVLPPCSTLSGRGAGGVANRHSSGRAVPQRGLVAMRSLSAVTWALDREYPSLAVLKVTWTILQ